MGKINTGATRAEYIEVEPNVNLHITDAGEGRPIVLIHGWPLSDEMYEYQYNDLINSGFRAIGITLRGFGKSDKPYGEYNYNVHVLDIKKVLDKLDIKNAVLGGFSMGGPSLFVMHPRIMEPIFQNWLCLEQQPQSGLNAMISNSICQKVRLTI